MWHVFSFGREGKTGVAKRSLHLRTLLIIIIIINIIIIIIFNVIVILIIIIIIIYYYFFETKSWSFIKQSSQWSATLHGVDSKRINGLVTLKFQLEWASPGLQPMPLGPEARSTLQLL